ncbi:hypothetical protein RGR602_CH02258 [Rhizobium gallicum bv. gallicum R602sp]|uniref:Uncharacterized protein n=1 Tax=Rhizobium gallicum bv. gallicum R602sp TaxID=1041138 RepID=A0A0B4X4D9_9HYPH|nr:hypothetical protein RGR602_CH02258 [Rhizobium gallicum bv. gallicum R602sp]
MGQRRFDVLRYQSNKEKPGFDRACFILKIPKQDHGASRWLVRFPLSLPCRTAAKQDNSAPAHQET